MKILRVTLVVVALGMGAVVSSALWTAWRWPHPHTTQVKMKSGREVDVIGAGVISTLNPPVWGFEYRTRTSWRTYEELRQEVEALWPDIEGQAESSGTRKAFVKPVNFALVVRWNGWRPMITGDTSTAFTFEKDSEGSWRIR